MTPAAAAAAAFSATYLQAIAAVAIIQAATNQKQQLKAIPHAIWQQN
jgi:hypothetical protein